MKDHFFFKSIHGSPFFISAEELGRGTEGVSAEDSIARCVRAKPTKPRFQVENVSHLCL